MQLVGSRFGGAFIWESNFQSRPGFMVEAMLKNESELESEMMKFWHRRDLDNSFSSINNPIA